jgi:hypothetical protein
MKVIGLLSSEEEANELRYIAQICVLRERIRFVVHLEKVKDLMKKI